MEKAVDFENRKILYDLHIHSSYSDGTYSPYEVVELAKKSGLKGISITDHDEFIEDEIENFSNKNGIFILNGIEFSTTITNLHIIAYNFDKDNRKLREFLNFQREERKKAFIKMCKKAKNFNMNIEIEECFKKFDQNRILGRPHLAQIMVEKGYVKNIYEAFKKYLYTGGPLFVDYKKLHYREILNLINEIKGISVLAHPALIKSKNIEKIISDCIKMGLDGIEVFYPRHNLYQTQFFYKMANDFNLLITGGSDFHGSNKPDIMLGSAGLTEEEFTELHQRIFYHA